MKPEKGDKARETERYTLNIFQRGFLEKEEALKRNHEDLMKMADQNKGKIKDIKICRAHQNPKKAKDLPLILVTIPLLFALRLSPPSLHLCHLSLFFSHLEIVQLHSVSERLER